MPVSSALGTDVYNMYSYFMFSYAVGLDITALIKGINSRKADQMRETEMRKGQISNIL